MGATGSAVREPAVAGTFYPSDPVSLRADVERYVGPAGGPDPQPARAVVAPHAGYIYSGPVAGAVYAAASLPRDLIVMCPNHTGMGQPIAVMSRGHWRTPLGLAAIHEDLADRILACCDLATVDGEAHRREHSLEVQLPFLQVRMERFTFVPICVGTGSLPALTRLGEGLARAVASAGGPVGFVLSSDMSHYIPAESARALDTMAIERIVAMDPEGLHQVVEREDISMCGVAPVVAGLIAARAGGAASGRLVAYGNSGTTSGDYDRVVGYAGLTVS